MSRPRAGRAPAPAPAVLAVAAAAVAAAALLGAACAPEPEGLASAPPAATTVKLDFLHRPLPEIPLPNDVATRYDPTSPTGRRINASLVAPTAFERRTRELIDGLDGWGVFQPITIPFTGPLDVASILARHRGDDYALEDDVIYLVDIDPDSPERGRVHHLDLGQGNFPVVLESRDEYGKADPRVGTISLLYEETDEDLDGDGVLDPDEDTDADGTLDRPNYLPGAAPAADDLAARADALMTFYERETSTLIVRPMRPLRERTRYAVVVTRRLLDADGQPVGSPYPWINHAAQTEDLRPLLDLLPAGLALDDVAFAFSFTTQSTASDWIPVREGLHGVGVQAHLGRDFPARIEQLLVLRDRDFFPGMKNPYVVYGEQLQPVYELIAQAAAAGQTGPRELEAILDAERYIDFIVLGSFTSPQLFMREDEEGRPLPLNDQSWPADLDRVPAAARGETLWFWLAVPRKEVSARGQGKPAPTAILSHSYQTDHMTEALVFSGHMARHGLATLAIDHPSHGFVFDANLEGLVEPILEGFGVSGLLQGFQEGRAFDQNGDGKPDTGADYWTAYVFHTRDMVRQSMLDFTQLIRLLRSFDGTTRGTLDLDGDGVNELAGDFDADGVLDIGGDAPLHCLGGSLGGITSAMLGALAPELTAIAAISPGGGLADVGMRSQNPGVPEALMLRLMGPLYVGTPAPGGGGTRVEAQLPDLNDLATRPVATLAGLEPGDTVVATNLTNGERACARVSPEGTFRVAVESDRGDAHRLDVYAGNARIPDRDPCELLEGVSPRETVDAFAEAITFQGEEIPAGTPLRALGDGLGLRRANPELRRLLVFAQAVLDRADPAVFARHFTEDPIVYPNLGDETHTHALIVPTIGDMSVPVSAGLSLARGAGFVDYLREDPRYGKTPNQVLIDTYTYESTNVLGRYVDPATGEGVHLDVDDFGQGTEIWAGHVPRLDPPLRLVGREDLAGRDRGGVSGLMLVYPAPEGQHAFPFAGRLPDRAVAMCEAACEEDDCDCEVAGDTTFDVGYFVFNVLGRYFATGAQELSYDLCASRNDCAWIPPVEAVPNRPEEDLDP